MNPSSRHDDRMPLPNCGRCTMVLVGDEILRDYPSHQQNSRFARPKRAPKAIPGPAVRIQRPRPKKSWPRHAWTPRSIPAGARMIPINLLDTNATSRARKEHKPR